MHRARWPALVVAVLAALPYLPSLGGAFLDYDDPYLIADNRALPNAGLGPLLNPLADRGAYGAEYLPVRDLTYLLDARLAGRREGDRWVVPPEAASWFRAVNLAWYALACGLATLCLTQLPAGLRPPLPVALLAGLCFAWHPAHAESVAWVAGRKDVVSGALALGAVAAHLRAREAARAPLYALSAGLAGLACLAKSTATCIPFLLLAIELADPARVPATRRLRRLLPTLLVCGAIALLALAVGRRTGIAQPWRSPLLVVLVDLVVLRRYLVTAFVPLRLQVDHADLVQHVAPDGPGLGGLPWLPASLALVSLIPLIVLIARHWHRPTARLSTVWFLAGLLPVLNLVPFVHWIADRFLFLPLLGPCLLGAWGLSRAGRGRVALAASALVLALLAGRTTARALDFRRSETLWRAQLRADPENALARSHLGQALLARADTRALTEEAERELTTALERFAQLRAPSPAHALEAQLHRGDARRRLARWAEALADYRQVAVEVPRFPAYAPALRRRLERLAGQALDGGLPGLEVTVRALVLAERPALAREALAHLRERDPARARALASELELGD